MLLSEQLKNQRTTLLTEASNLLDQGKLAEAKAKREKANSLVDLIQAAYCEEQREQGIMEGREMKQSNSTNNNDSANAIRAMIKKVAGKKLTDVENALLLPSTSTPNGGNGEGYILPEDVRTTIVRKIRQYKSLRDVVGHMPVSALTGSFPVEDFETVTELIDFTDGTDGEESEDISFKTVKYSLKEKAAFIKLSNTLLTLSDEALIEYVAEVFAKKAVITENKMIMEAINTNKKKKTLTDWNALRSSINKDLDPAVLYGTVIVTNQDGYDELDGQLDSNGRPILSQDPTVPGLVTFKGYPIKVYSNSLLKSIAAEGSNKAKAPIIYGNLIEAIKFVDLNQVGFATSSDAGFMSNTTIARLIEFIDVVQVDDSDKVYMVGEMEIE